MFSSLSWSLYKVGSYYGVFIKFLKNYGLNCHWPVCLDLINLRSQVPKVPGEISHRSLISVCALLTSSSFLKPGNFLISHLNEHYHLLLSFPSHCAINHPWHLSFGLYLIWVLSVLPSEGLSNLFLPHHFLSQWKAFFSSSLMVFLSIIPPHQHQRAPPNTNTCRHCCPAGEVLSFPRVPDEVHAP